MAAIALVTLAAHSSARAETPGVTADPRAAPTTPARAAYGNWGVDLASRDTSVRPGDDFYRYANGHWLATQEIPADRARWSTFDQLARLQEERLRELVGALPAAAPAGSIERKIGDTYRAYLDVEAIERAGLEPARAVLDAIAAARSHADIARLMGRPDIGSESPIGIGVSLDQKNPNRYIAVVGAGGLALPDRDYYLKEDAASEGIRLKYRAHIERILTLAGERQAARQAQAVLALETRIAARHWPAAKSRQRELTYNPRTRQELQMLAPRYPWNEMLTAAGLNSQREFIVFELDAVAALGEDFRQVPVSTWRSYLQLHYLDGVADVLPQAFDAEAFDFYSRTLNGQSQQQARWRRAVQAVGGSGAALDQAVGQLYVERHFTPLAKARMLELVENLRKAYAERIRNVPWMTQATRERALEKLATFHPKIGYPDKPRDYSALEVRAGDAFGNMARARSFEYRRRLEFLSKPADRDEWSVAPQVADAFYNATFNEIIFPAGILQPPFFDLNADPAVNYGAIGSVIGHEMGHGFDDQGAKSDAQGVLRTWWQPEDETAFSKLGQSLASQYDRYEALPGLHLNGHLTLGENMGDLAGVTVAYHAYRLSLQGRPAPVLDGLSGEQRFFLSFAQSWHGLIRDERLRKLVLSDPHSPPLFRVNGVVRNLDAWYAAFDVQPGDTLYLPPEERVRIW